MLDVLIDEDGVQTRTIRVTRFPCRIGRSRDNEVPLRGWRVARVHAELHQVGLGLKLVDMGTIAGTRVNGERVVEYGPLSERDEILVAGYRLQLQGRALHEPAASEPMAPQGSAALRTKDVPGADPVSADAPNPPPRIHPPEGGVPPRTAGQASAAGTDCPLHPEAAQAWASKREESEDRPLHPGAAGDTSPGSALCPPVQRQPFGAENCSGTRAPTGLQGGRPAPHRGDPWAAAGQSETEHAAQRFVGGDPNGGTGTDTGTGIRIGTDMDTVGMVIAPGYGMAVAPPPPP